MKEFKPNKNKENMAIQNQSRKLAGIHTDNVKTAYGKKSSNAAIYIPKRKKKK